ncbi:ABC transporter permease [Alphaproteobacteria bacterium LSUCC0684]
MMRWAIMATLLIPIMAGVAGVVFPAFGVLPVLGQVRPGVDALVQVMEVPGFSASVRLTLFTGFMGTFLSAAISLLLPGLLFQSPRFGLLRRYLAPVLSLPHVTMAVGLLFLLQPSGWLIRLISPWLTGWTRPPNLALVPDEAGIVLILGLMAKEVPFLVLMVLAALGQINPARLMTSARSLGYGQMTSWVMVVLPQLWPRMRLPVLIVLVFSLSVVDMAVVLAPGTPPPLAVRVLRWYQDPDLGLRFLASAGALVQLVLVVFGFGLLLGLEHLAGRFGRWISFRGVRFRRGRKIMHQAVAALLLAGGLLPFVLALMGLFSALIWSVAGIWRFPDALPTLLTLRYWSGLEGGLGPALVETLLIGVVSAFLGVVLVIIWLEQKSARAGISEELIFMPLLIPQIGFLFGLQIVLLWLGLDGRRLALIWAHLLFVFPYAWLTLAPSWRAYPREWDILAATMGKSWPERFFRVKLTLLLTPVLTAFAIGFSVSAALYLPTVFAGNARIQTLTVEAVTLATGAGRQPLGVATGLQMLLPFLVFVLTGAISHWRFRRFSGIS